MLDRFDGISEIITEYTSLPAGQIPGNPKLLVTPLQPEKLALFQLTSLEKSSKRALVLEADLGIPIHLLDIERFNVPLEPAQLAPEDEALLEVPP